MSKAGRLGSVRAAAVAVFAGICLAGWAPSAFAGGAETLELRKRALAVGSVVVARSSFDAHIHGLPTPADGPFYAYLLPAGPPWRSIAPPKIPHDAVPLGLMRIRRVDSSDVWWNHVAILRFTVPEVPTGVYGIHLCNDPCTVGSVGDLYGGGVVSIGATSAEGALAYRLWEQRLRLSRVRSAAQRLRHREADLLQTLEERSERLDQTSAQVKGLWRAVDRINERADRAVAANARSTRRGDVYGFLSLALAMALLVAIVGTLRARRARARGNNVTPDMNPGGIEDGAVLARGFDEMSVEERQMVDVAIGSHDEGRHDRELVP